MALDAYVELEVSVGESELLAYILAVLYLGLGATALVREGSEDPSFGRRAQRLALSLASRRGISKTDAPFSRSPPLRTPPRSARTGPAHSHSAALARVRVDDAEGLSPPQRDVPLRSRRPVLHLP